MGKSAAQVRLAVEQHTSLLKREATVRIKVWLTKLDEEVSTPALTFPSSWFEVIY